MHPNSHVQLESRLPVAEILSKHTQTVRVAVQVQMRWCDINCRVCTPVLGQHSAHLLPQLNVLLDTQDLVLLESFAELVRRLDGPPVPETHQQAHVSSRGGMQAHVIKRR